jgi:hypothetical protein
MSDSLLAAKSRNIEAAQKVHGDIDRVYCTRAEQTERTDFRPMDGAIALVFVLRCSITPSVKEACLIGRNADWK